MAAIAAMSVSKYIQALFVACGQRVNIHLCSDSTGAIGVASTMELQRFRHLDFFCGCMQRLPRVV